MCGICGIYHYETGEPVDGELLRRMTQSIVHRGPDDDGFAIEGSLGLGMRRLSIIDLEGGAQPIRNENGSVTVVMNGEIYNFRELRRELESHGHRFRTHSDTEVVVHAYEEWGLDGLARLNGMFGLAVWDAEKTTLVIARDPFGVKPLYYHDNGRTLTFGSEIRALLCAPWVDRSVDLTALREYVRLMYVPAPRTTFDGILKLLPGHAIVAGPGGTSVERFYRRIPRSMPPPGRETIEALRSGIEEAVRRQMVADVPVGAMLSGGVDSAAVATLMTAANGGPIDTFTVGFGEDFADDELAAARETAHRIGSRHHEIRISADDYAEFLPRSIWHLEEPVATTSTLAFFRVCELARSEVKVVLTGQGADEAFGGYPRYVGERYGGFYRGVPEPLRNSVLSPLIGLLPRNEQLKRAVRSLGISDPVARMRSIHQVIDDELDRTLMPWADPGEKDEASRVWLDDVAGIEPLAAMMYVDARTSLPDNLLLFGDKMSMAVSLEARVPFLDLELMALAESLPSKLKIRGRTQKWVFKKAIEPWVPQSTIRRKKIGFATPIDGWLRGSLRGYTEERLLTDGSACRTYFDPRVIRGLLDDHARGRHDHKRVLFALLTFELWHDQFIRPARWATP